ncbi:MAG: response regulator [Deltaproteobacteria bacterium]|nr:response regulator [Deltaproteobacteria bacterium]MBW2324030.1 response regulator [Deltaproteobacteria bacterium]
MKLLIVDDEIEILHMLERVFSFEGYNITITTRPLEALDMMKTELFDLVLADIQMPEMNGFELVKELKKLNPLAGVILMTENSSLSELIEYLSPGAVGYFTKPFANLNLLVETINEARKQINQRQFDASNESGT